MRRSEDRLLDVELVEVDAEWTDDPADFDGPSPARVLLSRVPRRAWAATAVVALVATTGVTVAREVAEARLDARLAEVDGLTSSLAAPLEEVWRTPGSGPIAVVGDVLLWWGDEFETVLATDVDDGSTRYTVRGSCQVVQAGDDAQAPSFHLGALEEGGAEDLLLCVEQGAGGVPTRGPGARLDTVARVVAPATGEVLRTLVLPHGGSWYVLGGDVVSIGLDGDQHVVAGRWSLETGRPLWSYRSAEAPPDPYFGQETSMDFTVVGMRFGDWSVSLDVATGAETDAEREVDGPPERPVTLPGGGSMTVHPGESGIPQTTVRPPDGGEPFTVPGYLMVPFVDDGSVPDAVLTLQPGESAGLELALVELTGRTRWTSALSVGQVGVLSGRVLVHEGSGVTVLDADTGETRWTSTPGPAPMLGWDLVTDGRRLLAVEGRGRAQSLVARDLATGATIWTAPTPTRDASLIPLPDGTVLAVGTRETVALRP